MPAAEEPTPAVDAALTFVARSPSALALAPLEDLLGQAAQPNLPGTIDEHPNWRRRHAPAAAAIFETPAVRARVEAIGRAQRGETP
jgi:4-alpha-glucanotransferase